MPITGNRKSQSIYTDCDSKSGRRVSPCTSDFERSKQPLFESNRGDAELLKDVDAWEGAGPLFGLQSVYIHIPFCHKKCPYCHFYSLCPKTSYKTDFLKALLKEIKNNPLLHAATIYIGGGTPSMLDIRSLEQILKHLPPAIEITIEANPNDLTLEKVKQFKAININRISIGCQSFDDISLKILQRNHSAKTNLQAIENSFNGGIDNISVDLMYDIPDQTIKSFKKSLNIINSLPIKHLSLYNLTLEPNTPFYKEKDKLLPRIAKDDKSLLFFKMAIHHLKNMGFTHYEISAFAKKGYLSKHNVGYWTNREFFGFGPSAFSYVNGKRFQNVANLFLYIKNINNNLSPIDFKEELNEPAKTNERLIIGLRMLKGININHLPPLHPSTQQIIKKLLNQKLLKYHGSTLSLSKKGLLFYDLIAEELV
jgi:oxygen-independent coproporphyrinogen-3 oxidase